LPKAASASALVTLIALQQRRVVVHDAHAAAAAAARGLDDDRVADVLGDAQVLVAVLGPSGAPEPGTQGTPAFFMILMAETLSPIMPDHVGAGR
jgi:hypothetical protein